MMHASIARIEATDTETVGVLLMDDRMFCYTLELPWQDNYRNVSCIPEGHYKAKAFTSASFGQTFVVEDVPNRDGILFHVGNTVRDTTGCILLGKDVGMFRFRRAVLQSQVAMNAFRKATRGIDVLDLFVWWTRRVMPWASG